MKQDIEINISIKTNIASGKIFASTSAATKGIVVASIEQEHPLPGPDLDDIFNKINEALCSKIQEYGDLFGC